MIVRFFRTLLVSSLPVFACTWVAHAQSLPSWSQKAGPVVRNRALSTGFSRVVIRAAGGATPDGVADAVRLLGGSVGRALPLINAVVATLPNAAIESLASSDAVDHISIDRRLVGATEHTGATIGATTIRSTFGYDGSGVVVATIDSGITAWHDDLGDSAEAMQRIDRFVDFVNGQEMPYDDYGHGTHVAGIIAGNGFDSTGGRTGIAPGAHLVVLKVLDAAGEGHISDVIAALDYVVAHKDELNIRIVNLSVAAGVSESYVDDPLTLAAQRAVSAGIVVVAAAGNAGRNSSGTSQYGGVMAPGNAPWVLTVGASSHMGTDDRSDDAMAAFSSRGPTPVDYGAKPDLVAPGVGIESLSDPNSAFYTSKAAYLLDGTVAVPYLPYLSLSGTSMATPVVSGTVALMLQANPSLTPNAVKAILQYTAQPYASYDHLTEGTGFLNALGAVELARSWVDSSVTPATATAWSGEIIWNNHVYAGGPLPADAAEWSTATTWGSGPWTEAGWHAQSNAVWGDTCAGDNCSGTVWTLTSGGDSVYATDDETVVWGTTDSSETVVWGTSDDENTVVWGTSCSDPSCEPIIWNRQ